MKYLAYGISFVVFVIISSVWGGYVLSVLWEWFLVSHFDLKPLSIPVAIGLAMILSYTTHQYDQSESTKEPKDRLVESIIYSLMKPAFALFAGWIVTLFM